MQPEIERLRQDAAEARKQAGGLKAKIQRYAYMDLGLLFFLAYPKVVSVFLETTPQCITGFMHVHGRYVCF